MKRILSLLIFVIPHIVLASEGAESHGPDYMGLFWRIIVFAVFAFILVKVLKKPLNDFLTKRTADIEKAIADAQKAKEQAETELKEYKSKLAQMNKELEDMKERAMKSAEAEKERILEEASNNIDKLRSFAENMIESDLNRAKEELRKETFRLALKLAEEKLGNELSGDRQKLLMQEYIKKIGAIN
ncbi:ATP synthase F0 subunit B [Deferribacterales bacterium Es71-Z0220]|uniref:ATP synthase F0 subunit B n=1 Tax=Deferrivibrio essentukiensis TaxID=2880922 RepID=UPI001F624669|nr:ATP synthase F0 subunit B [Deferrivibrio essentukiensis]